MFIKIKQNPWNSILWEGSLVTFTKFTKLLSPKCQQLTQIYIVTENFSTFKWIFWRIVFFTDRQQQRQLLLFRSGFAQKFLLWTFQAFQLATWKFSCFCFFFLYLSESILLLAHELYEDPEILWNETILFAASPLSERGNFLIVEILLGPILITGKITLGFGCVFHYELLWAFPQFPLFLAHSLNSNAVTWCWGLERKGTKWNI